MRPAGDRRHLKPWHFLLAIVGAGLLITLLPSRLSRRDTVQSHARITLLCDFLPTYIFARNVVGDVPDTRIDLLIAQQTGCPHDYSLRPEDLALAARADVIIANGLGLDPFLDSLRKASPRAKVITISDDCDLLPAHPAEHAAESKPADHHNHEDAEVNAHVWASPAQAIRQVHTLARRLSEIDPASAARYTANADAYANRLQQLLEDMRAASAKFGNRNIVTFHDAFAYLARDLDLNVVATLTQDPEYAPSASEVAGVIDTIRRTHAAAVFYEPAYSDRLARTIGRDAGVPIYALNPVNSTTGAITPATYEDIMRDNLRVLQQALGGGQ
jgi:zinc transport system substrate-binding protein